MQCQVFVTLMTVIVITYAETYTDKFDYIDIDEIIANPHVLYPYLKCLLNKEHCVPAAKELKSHIKDAIETGCSRCTDKQKSNARKVMKHLEEKEKEYWAQLKAKYDPKGEHKDTYHAFLAGKL